MGKGKGNNLPYTLYRVLGRRLPAKVDCIERCIAVSSSRPVGDVWVKHIPVFSPCRGSNGVGDGVSVGPVDPVEVWAFAFFGGRSGQGKETNTTWQASSFLLPRRDSRGGSQRVEKRETFCKTAGRQNETEFYFRACASPFAGERTVEEYEKGPSQRYKIKTWACKENAGMGGCVLRRKIIQAFAVPLPLFLVVFSFQKGVQRYIASQRKERKERKEEKTRRLP